MKNFQKQISCFLVVIHLFINIPMNIVKAQDVPNDDNTYHRLTPAEEFTRERGETLYGELVPNEISPEVSEREAEFEAESENNRTNIERFAGETAGSKEDQPANPVAGYPGEREETKPNSEPEENDGDLEADLNKELDSLSFDDFMEVNPPKISQSSAKSNKGKGKKRKP